MAIFLTKNHPKMKLIAHLSENLCKVIPYFLKFGRILGT